MRFKDVGYDLIDIFQKGSCNYMVMLQLSIMVKGLFQYKSKDK